MPLQTFSGLDLLPREYLELHGRKLTRHRFGQVVLLEEVSEVVHPVSRMACPSGTLANKASSEEIKATSVEIVSTM